MNNKTDHNSDRFLQSFLDESVVDCQESDIMGNADLDVFNAYLFHPQQPALQNFLPQLGHLQFPTEDTGLQDRVFPDTPSELPGGVQEAYDRRCPPAGGLPAGGDALPSSFLAEEDTVFKFPPDAGLLAMSFVPHSFDDLTLMETPPATPTDPSCLFNSYPGQHPYDTPYQQSTTTTTTSAAQTPRGSFLSLLNAPLAPLPPPLLPRRERLLGISNIEDEDFHDAIRDVLPEDVNVFSDSEMPPALNAESAEPSLAPDAQEFRMEGSPGSLAPSPISGGGDGVEHLEPRLRDAWHRSQGSQSLSPLLKEELRLKIMKKRLENGEEELTVDDFNTASPSYQMTEEDLAKRSVRRAQNRGAAQRFRQRKKAEELEIKKEMEEKKKKNEHLRREVALLRGEEARLGALLQYHRRHCRCRHFDNNNSDTTNSNNNGSDGNFLLLQSLQASDPFIFARLGPDPSTAASSTARDDNDDNDDDDDEDGGNFLQSV